MADDKGATVHLANINFFGGGASSSGANVLENYGAPSLTGAGFIFKFAFEREGVHSVDTLKNELDGIVLNGGTIDTKSSVNMEFTKQDLL